MSSIPQTFYVYVLARPDGRPFYVGKGTGKRIYKHDSEARSGHKCLKCSTIRKIWKSGGEVQRYVIFTTNDEAEALAYEIRAIALYGRENLTNETDGGEGVTNLSEEARVKIGRASRQMWSDPETRSRIKQTMADPEKRAKQSARLTQKWSNPEARAHQSAVIKQICSDPEVKAKKSAASKKAWSNPEARARQSLAVKAMWARRKAERDKET